MLHHIDVHLSSRNSVKYTDPNFKPNPTLNPNPNRDSNPYKIIIINSTVLCAPRESVCICTVTHSDRRYENLEQKLIPSDSRSKGIVIVASR